MNFKKKYIGDRAFYKMLFALVLPLIIQQGLTNFASLADNLMVGALGTTPMSSVVFPARRKPPVVASFVTPIPAFIS